MQRTLTTAALAALLVLPLTSEAGGKRKAADDAAAAAAAEQAQEDARVKPDVLVEVDFNEDGAIDVRNYYVTRETGRILIKKETDLNLDGRVDVLTEYDEAGAITRESMDGDFDGTFEWFDTYRGGQRVLAEIDTNFDGKIDVKNHYAEGHVTRKERDTNGDGDMDFWETFDAQGVKLAASNDVVQLPVEAQPSGDPNVTN